MESSEAKGQGWDHQRRKDRDGIIRTVGGVIMYYDRTVKYLDNCERGERIRGGVHAK